MFRSDRSLLHLLRELAAREPDKRLLGGEDGWYSAAETLKLAEAAARRFAELGLRPGDYAALRAERCPETALLIFALRAAGVVAVLTNPRQEIEASLAESDAEIPLRARIERRGGNRFSLRLDGREEILTLGGDAPGLPLPETDPMAPAFVIFTSGSTGKSKAVVQCENCHISNLIDSQPLGCYSEEDVALGALPLEHVFGLVLLCGTVVLRYALFFPPKTDLPCLLGCIEREKITRMNGVPSLYLAMAEKSADYDLRSLRAGFIGGGPVTAAQFARIERDLGMTLISVYGMSECIGISCASYLDPQDERAAGVGPVYPMNEIRLLTPDGREAAPGQEVEICVRSPMRMLGYYGSPMPEEDFFPTGDLGWLDEKGALHLSGRKKDIIIRNGCNLSARRIEDALLSLPGVRAAAVVGLRDERQGEVPYAMIVGEADEAALQALLHKNEWPAGLLSVDALPMTATGKPDKPKIREVLQAWRSS